MENIFSYNPDNSNLLFNFYNPSYNGSDQFNIYQSPDSPIFEFYGSAYDSSDLFLEDYNMFNKPE